ncbi:hypothetical protein PG985_007383 [Apiospora marii]|uniref:Uncharacterized protein n=1 Tax=Apiospora marii TaxID=335849 RepID=A0ABR1SQH0_9PEZI
MATNGLSNGTGSRAHTPEPVRQMRVVVQPPTHIICGEWFNRPLVVLGPLDASYYLVDAVDTRTGETAELFQTNTDNENRPVVHPQQLQVGVRSTPIPDGYDTPSERYYDADEEGNGFGYAVWTDLAISRPGSSWKIWIRAMDERDDPLCAVKTITVNVQDLDVMVPHPQPETFGFDQMLWLQRLRRKYPDHAALAPFKEEFWFACTHPDCLIREVHTMWIGQPEPDADWLYRVEEVGGGPEAVESAKGVQAGGHDGLPIKVDDDDDNDGSKEPKK